MANGRQGVPGWDQDADSFSAGSPPSCPWRRRGPGAAANRKGRPPRRSRSASSAQCCAALLQQLIAPGPGLHEGLELPVGKDNGIHRDVLERAVWICTRTPSLVEHREACRSQVKRHPVVVPYPCFHQLAGLFRQFLASRPCLRDGLADLIRPERHESFVSRVPADLEPLTEAKVSPVVQVATTLDLLDLASLKIQH